PRRVRVQTDRPLSFETPCERRPRSSLHDRPEERQEAVEGVSPVQGVSGVRDIAQVLLAWKIVEVEPGRVGEEERIARRVHDQLRQRETLAVRIRIFDPRERAKLARPEPLRDPKVDELLDRRRPEPIALEVVAEIRLDVEE